MTENTVLLYSIRDCLRIPECPQRSGFSRRRGVRVASIPSRRPGGAPPYSRRMRKLLQFVAQMGLTAVFAGFIGALLGGLAGLVAVAFGLAGSGDIYGFVIGGAGLLAVCTLVLHRRSPADDADLALDPADDGPAPDLPSHEPPPPRLRLVGAPARDDDEGRTDR